MEKKMDTTNIRAKGEVRLATLPTHDGTCPTCGCNPEVTEQEAARVINAVQAHSIMFERAGANQERRYLRSLVSDAYDALKILEENKTDPRQCDAAMNVAQRRMLAVFNRLTDKIVEHGAKPPCRHERAE